MHEFSLMLDLIRQVEALARQRGAQRVTSIKLRLGPHAHLSASHLRDLFPLVARGTMAEGARVDINVRVDPDDPYAHDVLLESVEMEV